MGRLTTRGEDSEPTWQPVTPESLEQLAFRENLPSLLFRAAVGDATRAVEAYRAARARVRAGDTGGSLMPLDGINLFDEAVRAGTAAIVLAVAAVEAQVDEWARVKGGWRPQHKRRDRTDGSLPLVQRCQTVAGYYHVALDIGQSPWQELRALVIQRNAIMHGHAEQAGFQASTAERFPARVWIRQAYLACGSAKAALDQLAAAVGEASPPFLRACPVVPAMDDATWG